MGCQYRNPLQEDGFVCGRALQTQVLLANSQVRHLEPISLGGGAQKNRRRASCLLLSVAAGSGVVRPGSEFSRLGFRHGGPRKRWQLHQIHPSTQGLHTNKDTTWHDTTRHDDTTYAMGPQTLSHLCALTLPSETRRLRAKNVSSMQLLQREE